MTRITTMILAASATLACATIAASAGAQSTPRATSAPVAGDADGAFVTASRFSQPTGEQLYASVCAGCHMPDGRGAQGAGFYPALARNQKLASGGYPLYVVMKGMNGMPPLGEMMTDRQVADVVNYVRSHFGNRYRDAVTPAEVQALR